MAWEPIEMVTPTKWHKFIGFRIGATTIAFAAAINPTAFLFGFEFLVGSSHGIAFGIGPIWFGFAVLRKKAGGASD